MKDQDLQLLRRHIARLPSGRRRRFPPALRARITAWVASRRTSGAPWSALASDLGLSAATLQASLPSLSIGKAAAYTCELGATHALRRGSADPAEQQRKGARHSRPGRRAQEPLRLQSRRGTEVAATLYTVLETLKLHRKDPAAYLHAAVLAADRGSVLLPWQFHPDGLSRRLGGGLPQMRCGVRTGRRED